MKLERAATALPRHGWQLLPLRFHRIDADSVVLTNLVGEHVFVTPDELRTVADGTSADPDAATAGLDRAAHLCGHAALRAHVPVLPGVSAVGGEERVRHD